jgi:hypothetical protein
MFREKRPTGSKAEIGNIRAHVMVILETGLFFTSVVAHQPKRISMSAKHKPVINDKGFEKLTHLPVILTIRF